MTGKETEALEVGVRCGGPTGIVSAWQVRTEFLCIRIPMNTPGPSHSVTRGSNYIFVAVAVAVTTLWQKPP